MSLTDFLARLFFRIGTTRGADRPFGELERKYLWSLPLSVAISTIGTLLEGFSIGLLIPLLGSMLAGSQSDDMIAPLQYVSDLAQRHSPDRPILFIGGVMLLLVLIKNIVGTAGGLIVSRIDGQAGADMRSIVARRLLRLPYSFFLVEEPPRLINIISSDSWRASDAIQGLYGIVSSAVAAIVLATLALLANWKLFLIVAAGALIARLLQQLVARRVKVISDRVSEANRTLGERMLLVVDLARLIRIFNQEEQEQAAFDKASENVRKVMYEEELASAWYGPVTELLLAALFILVLVVAQNMAMSVPEILAFLVLQYRLQPQIMGINQAVLDLASLSGSVKEVEWLLGPEEKPAAQGGSALGATGIAGPIRFQGVTYAFPFEDQPVIRDASFTIPAGSTTALIGRSGAGKSTMINLLLRMIDPVEGRILVGDRELQSIDPASWRSRIALAGQDVDLVEGSVADNIAFRHPGVTRDAIEEAARIADAHGFITQMAGGYDAGIGSYGMNLSGGQRQRISLARALVRKPELLILDEATNAVDGLSEEIIMQLLQEHRLFGTAIVISHRRSTLSACSQGIVIDAGRIVEAGPLRDLDFYREMERWPGDEMMQPAGSGKGT